MHDKVIILDFGSQLTQLIARRVREINVYCEIQPYSKPIPSDPTIKAVILSGSPASVMDANHPDVDIQALREKYPMLGICYGAQLIAAKMGGAVAPSSKREYGKAQLLININDPLFHFIQNESQVWMSHSDTITHLGDGFTAIASTKDIAIAAFCSSSKNHQYPIYGVQFHPEVYHTVHGKQLLTNFLLDIAKVNADWTPGSYIDNAVRQIRQQVGNDEVLLALSGGVDSSVAALIMKKAIGHRLHCFFVDNGLLRKNEYEEVLQTYRDLGLDVRGIDARAEFYQALKGISDPELKRKAIGRVFVEVFQRVAHGLPSVRWLCQGTIYPDVIESVSVHGPSATIKSHHNVGGLPDTLNLKIIEPLRALFKDEVRAVGKELHLPLLILNRHPFPGPGLAIRIVGDVTEAKVKLLQEADHIFISLLKEHGLYDKVWQAGAILLPIQTVGVMGDERTYEQVLALRAVSSTDGMTAEFSRIPFELLGLISNTIINQVKGINRIVYDISSKPPATIEWE